jgi:hypothetical protein
MNAKFAFLNIHFYFRQTITVLKTVNRKSDSWWFKSEFNCSATTYKCCLVVWWRCCTNPIWIALVDRVSYTPVLTAPCNLLQIELCQPSRWRQRSEKIHDTIWCCVGLRIFLYPHHMAKRWFLPQVRTNRVEAILQDTREQPFSHEPSIIHHGWYTLIPRLVQVAIKPLMAVQ